MTEADNSPFSIHPSGTDVPRLKTMLVVAKFEERRSRVCEQVLRMSISKNSQKKKTVGMLQPLNILEWTWENIVMDL